MYTENGQCPAFDAPPGSWQEGEEAQFKKAASLVDLAFRHDRGEEDGDALFREAYVVLDEMLRGHPTFYRSAAFWGLALRRQAEEKPDQEAVELLEDAEDKFRHAEAASDVSIKCYALSGEGLALAARGARTRGPKRDSLYDQACAKDREALNADPQYQLAANNWGDALRAQAEGKPGQEAIPLLEEAGQKYQTAEAASDLIVKCRALNGGGLALAARAALAKKPEERDSLYGQACEKYGEALEVDPQYYWADNNWGDALRAQAEDKPGQEAIALLEEAGHKYETAEAASDLIVKCHALTGRGRVLAARAALATKAEERDRLYGQAYAKYGEALNVDPQYYWAAVSWGNALCAQAADKPDQEAIPLLEEAGRKYEVAAAAASDVTVRCQALTCGGLALAAWAARAKKREERDRLYGQAYAKYGEALNVDPQYYWAAGSWGNALCAQAADKPDQEAVQLLKEAVRRYYEAAEAAPSHRKSWFLTDVGRGLAAGAARAKKSEERDRLYGQTYAKYGEALNVDPQYYWAARNWGDALCAQAADKPDQEAIPLLEEAGRKYEVAAAAAPDVTVRCQALTDGGRALAAWAARAKKREERDKLYGQAYAKYGEALNVDPQYYWAARNWGDALCAQAADKPDQEAVQLLKEAVRRYYEAAEAAPSHRKSWFLTDVGRALAAGAARAKKSEERDRLYGQAYAKYGEALKVDPQYYWAASNWGDALCAQAEDKPDQEAIPLLEEAGRRCEKAEAASDLWVKCGALNIGGIALAARAARAKKPEERDSLYGLAYAKFGEALNADPEYYGAAITWCGALCEQAADKPDEEAIPLLEEAGCRCEKAEAASDLGVKCGALMIGGIALAARAARAKKREERNSLYGQACAKYGETLNADPRYYWAVNMWGDALCGQVEGRLVEEAIQLLEEAGRKYEKAEAAPQLGAKCYALNGGGLALAARAARAKREERDSLYGLAYAKFGEALNADPEYYRAANNWGNALRALAEGEPDQKAIKLLRDAANKHLQAEAAVDGADRCAALVGGGLALGAQAVRSTGAECDRLFDQAYDKCREALNANSQYHEAAIAWADLLRAQAALKPKTTALQLLWEAESKYFDAERAPGRYEQFNALNGGGLTLAAQAHHRAERPEERARLYQRAYEKHAAALSLEQWSGLAVLLWAGTLQEEARGRSLHDARGLYKQSRDRYEQALAQAGSPLEGRRARKGCGDLFAETASLEPAEKAIPLFQKAYNQFETAAAGVDDAYGVHWSWGNALVLQAEMEQRESGLNLLEEACREYEKAVAVPDGPTKCAVLVDWALAIGNQIARVRPHDRARAQELVEVGQSKINEALSLGFESEANLRCLWGTILSSAGLYAEGLDQLGAAAAAHVQDPGAAVHALSNLASSQEARGDFEASWTTWCCAADAYAYTYEMHRNRPRNGGMEIDARWHADYGLVLFEVFGDLAAAEQHAMEGIQMDRASVDCHILRARIYREKADTNAAACTEFLLRAQEAVQCVMDSLKPAAEKAALIGQLDLMMEDFDEAEHQALVGLRSWPDSTPLLELLGIACIRKNRITDGVRCFRDAHERVPEDLSVWNNLAEAKFKQGALAEAEEEYQRILAQAPGHIDSRIGLGNVYLSMADSLEDVDYYEQAISEFDRAVELAIRRCGSKRLPDKDLADVYYLRGYARVKLHDLDEAGYGVDELRAALRDFRRAHKRHENHPKAKHAIDRVRKGLGHWTPSSLLEQYGPAIVALLALVLFVVTQVAFWAPPATLHMGPPHYFTLSVGALLLLIAGIYLPKVLKLKVAGIELEKAGIDQLSVRSLGLKLKRTERRGFSARSTPSFTSRATSLRESMKAGGRQQSINQPTLTRPQPIGVPEIHGG